MATRKVKVLTEQEITELWAMFGPEPVLSTESLESYKKIRSAYIASYSATEPLHVKWLREAVDNDWEVCRYGRHTLLAIERNFDKSRKAEASRAAFEGGCIKSQANELKRSTTRTEAQSTELARLEALVAKTELKIDGILNRKPDEFDHNLALERGALFHAQLDRSRNSATARRNHAVSMLQYYCALASAGSEAIDTEYCEVKNLPNQAPQISAPLVPSEEVADGVAAQNRREPGELPQE